MSLNASQVDALRKLKLWWASPELTVVLTAPGGYGKTYLLSHFLRSVDAEALLLAPTHEALAQANAALEGKLSDGRAPTSMTVHASLGIRPTVIEGSIEFKEGLPHNIWGDINLVIIDEASMLSSAMVQRLLSMKKKLLIMGHDAQLPPPNDGKRSITKTLVSPVFTLADVPVITLTEPMRNSGELHRYLTELERATVSKELIGGAFDVKKSDIDSYIASSEGRDALLHGDAAIIAWTNATVSAYNARVRKVIFDDPKDKYVPGDKVILTSPVNVIEDFKSGSLTSILRQVAKSEALHTNTPGTVLVSSDTTFSIDEFTFPIKKVKVETIHGEATLYEISEATLEQLGRLLEHRAWHKSNAKDKAKAYRERWDVLSSFANLQHSYAITAHRAQGRTIPTVVVLVADILRNPNRSEAMKCWYTAASRASKKLMVYKGTQ
jgi:hypothetical protein